MLLSFNLGTSTERRCSNRQVRRDLAVLFSPVARIGRRNRFGPSIVSEESGARIQEPGRGDGQRLSAYEFHLAIGYSRSASSRLSKSLKCYLLFICENCAPSR
jgi:hypothetical protein